MAKNVWIVVSDLHLFYKNLSGRVDYVEEMRKVRGKIVEVGVKYLAQGAEKVNLLLLGDVFHRAYRSTFTTGYDNNFFVMWRERFGDCYSVVGNHEFSYYESNPFFTLVSEIESEKVRGVSNKVWKPKGLIPIIRVVDHVEDGEVVFHFNHFGTKVDRVVKDGKVHVGLFHQEIVSREIVQQMDQQLGKNQWATPIDFKHTDLFDGYSYCFFGHMHTMYGVWKCDNGCLLCYLGSLGRTSVNQVNDNFLERDLPAIVVEDGKLITVESNKITLENESECLVRETVEANRQKYEIKKAHDFVKNYDVAGDDPVQNLKDFFANSPQTVAILEGLLENDVDEIGAYLRRKFNSKIQ